MTSVGSVDPWSAGDGCVPGGSNENPACGGSSATPDADGQPHTELLIGFLTDFHAAGREPLTPEPPVPPANGNGERALPSRFAAFVPPDPADALADQLLEAEPLPVWPPVPAAGPGPLTAAPETAPVTVPDPGRSRLRRFGRRA